MTNADKIAKLAANRLMVAFKEITTEQMPANRVLEPHGYQRASSGRHWRFDAASLRAVNAAAKVLVHSTDAYPLQRSIDHLQSIIVEETEGGTLIGDVHPRLQSAIRRFLARFETPDEWEVLEAVRGIDPNNGPFSIGVCKFYLMDDEQFRLWLQRYISGNYEPPPETPIHPHCLEEQAAMKGQFVAAARVRAVDAEHARTKARARIEEVLNLLRYGQLVVGYPPEPFPEIGWWLPQRQSDHCFTIQLNGSSTSSIRSVGGPIGNSYGVSRRAPAWPEIENILATEASVRDELQRQIVSALEWVGQAALAPTGAIRLVTLMTALEALLLERGEALGKKSKLADRVSRLIAKSEEHILDVMRRVKQLYGTRSECVRGEPLDIEAHDLRDLSGMIAKVLHSILTEEPWKVAARLTEILKQIEPAGACDNGDRRRWIETNAYLRWLNEGKPDGRQFQHWLDAERELACTRAAVPRVNPHKLAIDGFPES